MDPEVWSKITASLGLGTADATLLEILLDKLLLLLNKSRRGESDAAAAAVDKKPPSSYELQVAVLLLIMGEENAALIKATESGDTNLVYLVLFQIWEKSPSFLALFKTIQDLPRDLFISYARCCNHHYFLQQFFLSNGQPEQVAFLLWKESWALKGGHYYYPRIKLKLIEQARDLFLESKQHGFESKAAEEHAKLLRIQYELEASTQQAIFVDSSLSDTVRNCIVLGDHRAAIKLKTQFRVSDRRWYWLKAFALATIKDWDALAKFSEEKKTPPTGYTPFVEACIAAGEKGEALKYISKLPHPRQRADAYARMIVTDIDIAQYAASSLSPFHTLRGGWN